MDVLQALARWKADAYVMVTFIGASRGYRDHTAEWFASRPNILSQTDNAGWGWHQPAHFREDTRTLVSFIESEVRELDTRPLAGLMSVMESLVAATPLPQLPTQDELDEQLDDAQRVLDCISGKAHQLFANANQRHEPLVEAPPANPDVQMPPEWFKTKFGIPAERLRSARRTGRLKATKVGSRFQYSVADAMRLWPEDEIYMPETG